MTAFKPLHLSRTDISDNSDFGLDRGEITGLTPEEIVTRYEEVNENSNFLREMADQRIVDELSHGHTAGFSDGTDEIAYRIYEAAQNGVKRLAFTDHGDATGISGHQRQGYYGEEQFQTPDLLRDALTDTLLDENDSDLRKEYSFDVEVAAGMEIDFDLDNQEKLIQYIHNQLETGPLDMMLISVHYDSEGRNVGYPKDFGPNADPEKVVEEYYQEMIPAAAEIADKFPGVTTLAHWDRPEGNPFLADHITREMYEDALDQVKKYDVVLEFNAKTGLRNILNQGHPTLGSQVLFKEANRLTGGTDTHRIGRSGKVDYKVNETEARLQELETAAEETGKFVPVLEDLDLDSVRIPVERVCSNNESFSVKDFETH